MSPVPWVHLLWTIWEACSLPEMRLEQCLYSNSFFREAISVAIACRGDGVFYVLLAVQNLAVEVPSPGASLMGPLLEGMRKEEMNILCMSVCSSFLTSCHDLVAQNYKNVLSHSSEATSLKSRCWQGCTPSEVPGGRTFPCHFQLLVAPSIRRLVLA